MTALLLSDALQGQDQEASAPVTELEESWLSESVGGSGDDALKKILEGRLDDPEDKNVNLSNSVALNKLTGDGSLAKSKLSKDKRGQDHGHVTGAGYTANDAYLGETGHYYIGPSRRRIGAGFGRRRRFPPARLHGKRKRAAIKVVDRLGDKAKYHKKRYPHKVAAKKLLKKFNPVKKGASLRGNHVKFSFRKSLSRSVSKSVKKAANKSKKMAKKAAEKALAMKAVKKDAKKDARTPLRRPIPLKRSVKALLKKK